jgi:hypothetical protein
MGHISLRRPQAAALFVQRPARAANGVEWGTHVSLRRPQTPFLALQTKKSSFFLQEAKHRFVFGLVVRAPRTNAQLKPFLFLGAVSLASHGIL